MNSHQQQDKRLPLRIPLLPWLIPLVIGYLWIELFRPDAAWFVGSSSLLISASVILAYAAGAKKHLRNVALILAVIPLAGTYYTLRVPPPEPAAAIVPTHWTAREGNVQVELDNLWRSSAPDGSRLTGTGTVLEADAHFPLEVGGRITFSLANSSGVPRPIPGSLLQLHGVLRTLNIEGEHNAFNRSLAERGIRFRMAQGFVTDAVRPAPDGILETLNHRFEDQLRAGLPEAHPLPDVYVAMLLGKREVLSHQQIDAFRATGTMHFFAISGLHIGVIALTLAQILIVLRLPILWVSVIGLSALGIYVLVAGAPPSAVRAYLMTFCFWVGIACFRQHSALSSWTNAAVLVLILLPGQLMNIGFQLSYAVVAAILLYGLPLHRDLRARIELYSDLPESDLNKFQRFAPKAIDFVLILFCVGLAAWLASVPLSMLYFGIFVTIAVLLNMFLITLGSVVIITGVLSLVSNLIGLAPVGAFLNLAALCYLSLMTALVDAAHALPFSSFEVSPAYPLPIILGLLAFLASAFALEWSNNRFPESRPLRSYLIPPAFLALGCVLGFVG